MSPERRCVLTLLLSAALLALSGCGPVAVRSAPPGADLDGLRLEDETLILRLRLENRNDVPLRVTGVRLQLTLDNAEIEPFDWPMNLELGSRNLEPVELRLPATGQALGRLEELERGERDALPYSLTGRLLLDDQRDERIDRNGFLHRVPGRPGQFR